MSSAKDILTDTLQRISHDPDYVNLRTIEGVLVDLRYATDNNFMHKNVYGAFTEPFLHREAADKLKRAAETLQRQDYRLVIYDALRPRAIQRVLWSYVVGTPQQGYVADPDRGSMHNFGCAVDLSIVDHQGRDVDMGTEFDTFDPLSQPKLEEELLQLGRLTQQQIHNRLILRDAMTGAGFLQLAHEWWHYDAFARDEVLARFKIVE